MACRVLQGTLPPRLRPWADAIESEVAEIADDGRALVFALGSLGGLMPRALASHFVRASNALTGHDIASEGISDMGISKPARQPRAAGIACATGAVLLGLVYMAAAGAPSAYLGTNVAALLIGILMIAILDTVGAGRIWNTRYGPGALSMALAVVLLATALFGLRVEGAARWVSLGGLSIQPSLILLPMMILAFARSRDRLSAVAIVIAAAALALQPDRAMACMLAAIVGVRHDPANRHIHVVFGTVWLSAVAAAALGNYPTPIVGYGGSAILGYVLSLAIMPRIARSAAVEAVQDDRAELQPSDRQLRVGLAC
jgi:hypothetical protein